MKFIDNLLFSYVSKLKYVRNLWLLLEILPYINQLKWYLTASTFPNSCQMKVNTYLQMLLFQLQRLYQLSQSLFTCRKHYWLWTIRVTLTAVNSRKVPVYWIYAAALEWLITEPGLGTICLDVRGRVIDFKCVLSRIICCRGPTKQIFCCCLE